MTLSSGQDNSPPPPGYTDHKPNHLARLHKVEGQIRGITRMVGDDRYCIDVLTQISAATHALQEVALALLDDHMRHCVTNAARSDPPAGEEKLDELAVALRRTLRLSR
ncbi:MULTISPECIES: metal-sensitive transcriptional regulator [unclassified Streptomyces]|uniref:metal-sensitive transcriptional regulator n=1 Tax=unclassified Streptomyces TaxID=2593676 RepID=UPI00036EF346|nr:MULTISPECIES: metal-sensitive transcriptional regulator [unclassified Streptomyces]MYX38940.1 metal-sensing transcriptional repressor [Streptomyces sp. SID8377]